MPLTADQEQRLDAIGDQITERVRVAIDSTLETMPDPTERERWSKKLVEAPGIHSHDARIFIQGGGESFLILPSWMILPELFDPQ
jgi:hypothetical protein